MSEAQARLVTLERAAGAVAVVTLNRPEKRNALTREMIQQWCARFSEAAQDESVNVILLRGEGPTFCAGGDVDEMLGESPQTAPARKQWLAENLQKLVQLIWACEKPVIAALHGKVRGAGLDIALCADIRISADTADFAETYIQMGFVSGPGGTWLLPRLIGPARALELFWTGATLTAGEALAAGLVNHVVAPEQLVERAMKLAHDVAAKPAQAVRMFKRLVRESAGVDLSAHLDAVSSHMAVLWDTREHTDRVEALRQRMAGAKS